METIQTLDIIFVCLLIALTIGAFVVAVVYLVIGEKRPYTDYPKWCQYHNDKSLVEFEQCWLLEFRHIKKMDDCKGCNYFKELTKKKKSI